MKLIFMKSKTIIIVLSLICSMCICSCVSKEEKQETAISEYMNKTFADFPSYECVETIYLDSIQDKPTDYDCLKLGLRAYKALLGILNPTEEFMQSYADSLNIIENKRVSLNPETLTGLPRQKYFVWIDSVRSFAIIRQKLIQKVDNFVPYQNIRVAKKYRVCGDDGDKFLYARFYFDSNYRLKNQLILTEEENQCVFGMISMTMNRDFSPIKTLFNNKLIELPNDDVLNTLAQYPNKPIEELLGMSENYLPVTQVNNPSTTDHISSQNTTLDSYNPDNSGSYGGLDSYVVVVDKCAGAISEDANNRYARYSARDNIDEIQRMLVSGELIVLRRGDVVNMLHLGYVTSEVRLQDGRRVFVDTENISKR